MKRICENKILEFSQKNKVLVLIALPESDIKDFLESNFNKELIFFVDSPFLSPDEKIQKIKSIYESNFSECRFCIISPAEIEFLQKLKELNLDLLKIIEIPLLSYREISSSNCKKEFIPSENFILERRKDSVEPDILWSVIHRGSLPKSQNIDEFEDSSWIEIYDAFVKRLILEDVTKITAIKDFAAFRKFLAEAAKQSGKMLNYSEIAHAVSKDVMTIKHWISILDKLNIIFLIYPYKSEKIKRDIKTPKLYFYDCGLVCYLLNIMNSRNLAFGNYTDEIFENFVVSEIVKSYKNSEIDFKTKLSYYRGKDKKTLKKDDSKIFLDTTIDLIIEDSEKLYPIRIKQNFSNTDEFTMVFGILSKLEEKSRGTGTIICNCFESEKIADNLWQIPAWEL